MKKLLTRIVQRDSEPPKVLDFIQKERTRLHRPLKVLDVGCGYGRYLKLLREAGNFGVGIDRNPEAVSANRKDGLTCWTPQEFSSTKAEFDVVLMSHVIEHLTPSELLGFLDTYLDFLIPGGILRDRRL